MSDDNERLARIETKIDIILERGGDHEARLRAGERERWLTRVSIIGMGAYVWGKLGLPPIPAIF